MITSHAEQINHNHNVILASVSNSEARENTDELMNEVKKLSHRVHNGLKSMFTWLVTVRRDSLFDNSLGICIIVVWTM